LSEAFPRAPRRSDVFELTLTLSYDNRVGGGTEMLTPPKTLEVSERDVVAPGVDGLPDMLTSKKRLESRNLELTQTLSYDNRVRGGSDMTPPKRLEVCERDVVGPEVHGLPDMLTSPRRLEACNLNVVSPGDCGL
jgi:hypothetical protein